MVWIETKIAGSVGAGYFYEDTVYLYGTHNPLLGMENAEEIKDGDSVKLKTGGPEMTAGTYNRMSDTFLCQWFDKEDKLHTEWFYQKSLVLVKKP